jgi:hypothetical protein
MINPIALEQLIDDEGLAAILDALAVIADEKAEHIRASYEGAADPTAKAWERAGVRIGAAAGAVRNLLGA